MSLQDVAPWSIIYGELNTRHHNVLKEIVYSAVLDYVKDRMNHGWREKQPCKYFSSTLRLCLDQGLVSKVEIQRVRDYLLSYYADFHKEDNINYYLDYLVLYLSTAKMPL